MSFSCVIFDMDGTLVESETCSAQALKEMLPIPDSVTELVELYRGTRKADCLTDLVRRHGIEIPKDFEDRFRVRETELAQTLVTPIDGVHDMLEKLSMPYCIASNAPRFKTERSIQTCGLDSYFDAQCVFSAYEVGHWKPEPNLFLTAAEQMGFEPAQCLVLEDSSVGVAAALAAKMTVIMFSPEGANPPDESVRVIRKLSDFPEIAN